MSAEQLIRSVKVARMRVARLTTRLLVSGKPSGVNTKPEPLPAAAGARRWRRGVSAGAG